MSQRLRILLVGQHYWPHGSIDSGFALYQLSTELRSRNIHVEVLTPKYSGAWPERLEVAEIQVHRPLAPPRVEWTSGRYTRQIANWIRERASSYDAVMADSIRDEAIAVVEGTKGTRCLSLLRYSGWGDHSDGEWWNGSRSARKCALVGRESSGVLCPDAVAHRVLLENGFREKQIHRVGTGIPVGTSFSHARRRAARVALASANSDLQTREHTPVVVCFGRMTADSGMNEIARLGRSLIAKIPDLKIWFIGDGPHRDRLFDRLRGDGIRSNIAMPGSFCSLEDLFAAADLFVQHEDDGLSGFLPMALASELPTLVVDRNATRQWATATGEVQELLNWYTEQPSKSLRLAITEILADLPRHREHASMIRQHLVRQAPFSGVVDRFLSIIHRSRRPSQGVDSSIEALS